MARKGDYPEFESQASPLWEEEAESRRMIPGQLLRWGIAFSALFGVVFFFFWWSGRAIEFGAARVSERPVATWRVHGKVTDAKTGQPVAWAVVRDDPGGRPPYFQSTADHSGNFELLTLAEPHMVLVEGRGYYPSRVQVGRNWFVWWPKGEETVEVGLNPE